MAGRGPAGFLKNAAQEARGFCKIVPRTSYLVNSLRGAQSDEGDFRGVEEADGYAGLFHCLYMNSLPQKAIEKAARISPGSR